MRVELYWNLHKNLWSVRTVGGRIIGHVTSMVLEDCTFVVQPAGREKVRREKRKNVHAFVRGSLPDGSMLFSRLEEFWSGRVLYNPYKYDTFVNSQDEPVHEAKMVEVWIDEEGKGSVFGYWPKESSVEEHGEV